jgi:hypothetical protein
MDNAGQKIAQGLADTFTFKGARDAASHAIDSAKSGMSSLAAKAKSAVEGPKTTTYTYDQKAVAPKAAPAKKMPSYKDGTMNVPKTGPAKLHKGEAVLPKEHAQHLRDSVSGALGGHESKPKKEIKHIVTKKAKSGGYIHEHHHTHPEHHPMEEHVSSDKNAMMAHMMEHMSGGTPDADAGGDAASAGGDAGAAMGQGQPMPMGA